MKDKRKFAVITGDIVNSSSLNTNEREHVLNFIKSIFKEIEEEEGKIDELKQNFEITRGDSFQIIVKNIKTSLKFSIMLRAGLKSLFDRNIFKLCDTRISIGIGDISYWGESVSESDGDAFKYSGRIFDKFKNKDRLFIKTFNEELDKELIVYFVLLDSIISDWTSSRAQIIYEKLKESKQLNIAKKIGVSDSAVSKRLNSAHWNAVESLIKRYETIFK